VIVERGGTRLSKPLDRKGRQEKKTLGLMKRLCFDAGSGVFLARKFEENQRSPPTGWEKGMPARNNSNP